MNNGRYLQIMDVARASWMTRTGVIETMRGMRWGASLGGGTVRFRRSLKPFQRYQVTTRLIGWDDRWFYLEHGFLDTDARCIAVGLSRAALRGARDWVHTDTVLELVDPTAPPLPIPDYVRQLTSLEETLYREFCRDQQAINAARHSEASELERTVPAPSFRCMEIEKRR